MKVMKVMIVDLPSGYEDKYPFKNGESVLFLGEIKNMRGHCTVVNRDGKVFWGYHTDDFRNPTEDEL
jgi:hypothetical protein